MPQPTEPVKLSYSVNRPLVVLGGRGGDFNFQFVGERPVPPQADGVVGIVNWCVFFFIAFSYSKHYGLIVGP